jgi:hypothetical protein
MVQRLARVLGPVTPVRIRRVTIIGLLIFTTTVTAGCEYLRTLESTAALPLASAAPSAAPTPDTSDDPGTGNTDPFGPAQSTYRTGSATLTIGDSVIKLDRLAGTGTMFKEFGADVVWAGEDGWYLQVGGATTKTGPEILPPYISLDRVANGQHWVTWDPDGCEVKVTQADPGGVEGTATCKNMRWVDAIAGGLSEEPDPIEGQAAFGATISFVARP